MAHELGCDLAVLVKRGLEGKDDHHARDALLHPAKPLWLPRPELRADEVDDRNVERAKLVGEAEVDVREVDEDGGVGAALSDAGDETAIGGVDARRVAQDLG